MKLKDCCINIFQKHFNVGEKFCPLGNLDLKRTITKFVYEKDENGEKDLWMHAISDKGYKSAYNLEYFYNKVRKTK